MAASGRQPGSNSPIPTYPGVQPSPVKIGRGFRGFLPEAPRWDFYLKHQDGESGLVPASLSLENTAGAAEGAGVTSCGVTPSSERASQAQRTLAWPLGPACTSCSGSFHAASFQTGLFLPVIPHLPGPEPLRCARWCLRGVGLELAGADRTRA